MKKTMRHKHIMDMLNGRENLSVSELIDGMDASPATVRRDLVDLESQGMIRRAHGKVMKADPFRVPNFNVRGYMYDDEKKSIGKAAAALVMEGDSIIIDAGTTALALADQLVHREKLSVVTNSIPVANTFNNTKVRTFVTGGMLEDTALADEGTVNYLKERKVNKAFVGASGVRQEEGLTVVSPSQFPVKRQMIESADEVYALVDASKFSISGITLFASFSELTGLITSSAMKSREFDAFFKKINVKVFYAD